LHKIGRSEAWIRPPEPQDLAGELVGSLRGDPLVNRVTSVCYRLISICIRMRDVAGFRRRPQARESSLSAVAEEVRGVGPKEHHSSAEDPLDPAPRSCLT